MINEKNNKPRPTPPEIPCEYISKKTDHDYFLIFGVIICILIISVPLFIIKKEAITINCKLLNRSFKGSTLETNAVPFVGMGMSGGATVGVGLATSGHGQEFISSFDCGSYGILISDDKEIFRKAKEDNRLTVYFNNKNYKILDI